MRSSPSAPGFYYGQYVVRTGVVPELPQPAGEEGRGIRCIVRAVCVWLGIRAEQERGEDRYSTSILSMGFCLEM